MPYPSPKPTYRNQLDDKIRLVAVPPSHAQDPSNTPEGGPLAHALQTWNNPSIRLDFVMTNSPFYDPNSMEHEIPRAGDGRARTAMTDSEGDYPNGEVGFVVYDCGFTATTTSIVVTLVLEYVWKENVLS